MTNFCVVTGTRADFGLIRSLLSAIDLHDHFEYKLIAMGTHFSPEYGETYREILDFGITIDFRCDMLLSATSHAGAAKSFSLTTLAMADYFSSKNIDAVIILGDRYEALAVASAALIFNIPIIHLCGGEVTNGAIDDAIRHSISKMASIHFVANEEYRSRVIQLGERPETVHVVGGLGVDAICSTKVLTKSELEQKIDYRFGDKNLLVTYHPVTRNISRTVVEFQNLLAALESFPEIHLLFTMPNADPESDRMWGLINEFVSNRNNSKLVKSMGQKNYYSALKIVDGVVGNSSSGIAEAPSFQIGTINIGNRQNGRTMGSSVISCDPNIDDINSAIIELYSDKFQSKLSFAENPYGDAGATNCIIKILEKIDFQNIRKSPFFDITQGDETCL